jgi:hypothetical protein
VGTSDTVGSRGGRVWAGLWRASRWRSSQFPTNVTIHLIDQCWCDGVLCQDGVEEDLGVIATFRSALPRIDLHRIDGHTYTTNYTVSTGCTDHFCEIFLGNPAIIVAIHCRKNAVDTVDETLTFCMPGVFIHPCTPPVNMTGIWPVWLNTLHVCVNSRDEGAHVLVQTRVIFPQFLHIRRT